MVNKKNCWQNNWSFNQQWCVKTNSIRVSKNWKNDYECLICQSHYSLTYSFQIINYNKKSNVLNDFVRVFPTRVFTTLMRYQYHRRLFTFHGKNPPKAIIDLSLHNDDEQFTKIIKYSSRARSLQTVTSRTRHSAVCFETVGPWFGGKERIGQWDGITFCWISIHKNISFPV